MRNLHLLRGILTVMQCALGGLLYAQIDGAMSNNVAYYNVFLRDTPQFVLTLPSISYNFYTPDFKIAELLKPNSEGVLSANEVAKNRIQEKNRITGTAQLSTFGISKRVNNRLILGVQHAYKALSSANIDGNIFKVAFEGLDNYVSKTLNFHSTFNACMYSELALSGTYSLSNRLRMGLGIKYFKGISSFLTKKGDSQVTFENYQYAMSFVNNIDIRTYALDKLNTVKDVLSSTFSSKNRGIGFDLAITYSVNKWLFSFNGTDLLSKIYWQQGGTQLSSEGLHRFGGISTSTFIQQENKSTLTVRDSLINTFGLVTNKNIITSQKLNTQLFFTCLYQLNSKTRLGVTYHQNFIDKNMLQKDWKVSGFYKILPNIELGSSLNLRNTHFLTIGLNIATRFKNLQIIAATDNITSIFLPYNSHVVNGYVGLGVVLPTKKKKIERVEQPTIVSEYDLKKYFSNYPKIEP